MHEASIVEYVLNTVERSAIQHHIMQVSEITMEIGKLRVAIPQVLQKTFALMKDDYLFADTTLKIVERDIVVRCHQCGVESEISDPHDDRCSRCGSRNVKVIRGNELNILSFKGR